MMEAATVDSALIDRFFSVFEVPKKIHSDQGTNFESGLFKEIGELKNMKKHEKHHLDLYRMVW